MSLKTEPIFYYAFEVLEDCTYVDFKEGEFGVELFFQLEVGDFTAEEIRSSLEIGFNSAGTLAYTVTFDRFTRKYTIHANNYFELLLQSGSHAENSLLNCLGFSSYPVWGEGHLYGDPHLFFGNVDSGLFTFHQANFPMGLKYDPQYLVQDFVDAEDNEELQNAAINEAVDPREIEIIFFGTINKYEFNFRYITDQEMPCGGPIRNDPNALANINSFLKWGIRRKVIEYMPDKNNPSNYYIIRLEQAKGGGGKTSYQLKELVSKNLPGFFETGKLVFRRIENVY